MSLLLAASVHWNDDYMMLQWFLGLLIVALAFSVWIYVKLGLLPGITAFYVIGSALWISFFVENRYMMDLYRIDLIKDCLVSTACAIGLSFYAARMRLLEDWVLGLWAIINSFYVVAGYVFNFGLLPHGVGYSGFLNYAGMNGVLLACLFPYVWNLSNEGWIWTMFLLWALMFSASSICYGVLGAVLIGIALYRKRFWLASCGLIPFIIGWCVDGLGFFSSGYRFQAYKTFMGAWIRYANHWTGTGVGTFRIIAEKIQNNTGFMFDGKTGFYWPWMHSDWLQVVFELGMIGFLLIAALYAQALWRLYNKKYSENEFAMACGLGASAIFDYPLRYFATALLCSYVVAKAYRSDK